MTDESKNKDAEQNIQSTENATTNLVLESPLTSPDISVDAEISDVAKPAVERKPSIIFGTGELQAYKEAEPKLGVYINALDGATGEERTFLKAAATDLLIVQGTAQIASHVESGQEDVLEHHNHPLEHHRRHHKHSDFIREFEVSKKFSQNAHAWIHSVPAEHRRVLHNNGYHYVLAKDIKMYDHKYHTHYATARPEGYPVGLTGEATGAFYDDLHKNIVLCEHFKIGAAPETDTSSHLPMAGRARHESAHAIDEARGFKLQNSPEMIRAYDATLKTLASSPVTRHCLGYYLQPNEVNARGQVIARPGLREAIAELYAIKHGGGTDFPWNDKSLKAAFGGMLNIMTRKGY